MSGKYFQGYLKVSFNMFFLLKFYFFALNYFLKINLMLKINFKNKKILFK
jgi:hypothetical protein